MSAIRGDVIPFCMAYGEDLVGLNVVGLRRRGVTRPQLLRLRRAYRQLFFGFRSSSAPFALSGVRVIECCLHPGVIAAPSMELEV